MLEIEKRGIIKKKKRGEMRQKIKYSQKKEKKTGKFTKLKEGLPEE